MATISSDTVSIPKPAEAIFKFLINLNNWEQLMPEDRISNWQSTETECSFKISGLAAISMALAESTPNQTINVKSHGKNPFDFTINIDLEESDSNHCSGKVIFEADLNPMLKMMLEKPLTNFFNMLAAKLQTINV